MGLVLKEGGGFVHLRDDLITSSEMICSTSDVVRFTSEIIFSTSEIEKTTSELVGFISDAVLRLLDAHRGKKGQKVGGRSEGRENRAYERFLPNRSIKIAVSELF